MCVFLRRCQNVSFFLLWFQNELCQDRKKHSLCFHARFLGFRYSQKEHVKFSPLVISMLRTKERSRFVFWLEPKVCEKHLGWKSPFMKPLQISLVTTLKFPGKPWTLFVWVPDSMLRNRQANPFHLLAEPTVCERHLVRRIGNASTRLHLWKHYVQTCVRHWICPCSLTITTNVSSLHLFFSSGSCLATIINHQKQRKAENKKQKQTNK